MCCHRYVGTEFFFDNFFGSFIEKCLYKKELAVCWLRTSLMETPIYPVVDAHDASQETSGLANHHQLLQSEATEATKLLGDF